MRHHHAVLPIAVILAASALLPRAASAAPPPVEPASPRFVIAAGLPDGRLAARRAAWPDAVPAGAAQASQSLVYLPLALANAAPVPRTETPPSPTPGPPERAWCAHALGGPEGADMLLDLSRAHANVRFFGAEARYSVVDQALARALAPPDVGTEEILPDALEAYVAPLEGVCQLPAQSGALGQARVRLEGEVAIIQPGHGDVRLPEGTRAVAIDLRDVPSGEGVREALAAAIGPAMASPLGRPSRSYRQYDGLVDEVFSPANVYTNTVRFQEQGVISPTGSADLPLAVVTGPRLGPEAAELAATVRLARRGWLVGDDVHAAVAESRWSPVGQHGLLWRAASLVVRESLGMETLRDQPVQQDEEDVASTTYRHDFRTTTDSRLGVRADGPDGADLDLYVLYDDDGSGTLEYPAEVVASSLTPSADEDAEMSANRPPGLYQVWVHGYGVPEAGSTFDLEIEVLVGQRWPDVAPADAPVDQLDTFLASLPTRGSPPAVDGGPRTRRPFEQALPYRDIQPTTLGPGELRAALVTAHGALRLNYPYFPTVGDGIDGRLRETLATVDAAPALDRGFARNVLRRFGEVLKDGHNFIFNYGGRSAVGYMPLFLEQIGGEPVVRRSGVPEVAPGDTIIGIDGRPAADWYAEELARSAAATDGYRFDIASRELLRLEGPLALALRDPDGATRIVNLEPRPVEEFVALGFAPSMRPAGWLADLDAPTLYYLNLDTDVLTSTMRMRAALTEASEATGMVLDMRGYPGSVNHYEVATRLISETFGSPHFIVGQHNAEGSEPRDSRFDLSPAANPSYHGPIALLVGPVSVSAAENFSMMLVGAHRVTVVGRRSAGTNGNITGVQLPGGFGFTYTGMGILFPDGSPFHGIGIVPDVPVQPTAADFRAGRDPELLAAIEVLRQRR